jgi:SSS family solute:Na+ symporter
VAVGFSLKGGDSIVALLLMGYNFVTQLFPALVCSLAPRNRVTKQGAFCGILAGALVVALTTLMHVSVAQLIPFAPDALKDINIGFLALGVNIVVLAAVSVVTQPRTHADHEPAGAH